MHETFATLRRRRHRGRYSLGAIKPDLKLDPGFPHLEMRLDHHRRASVVAQLYARYRKAGGAATIRELVQEQKDGKKEFPLEES